MNEMDYKDTLLKTYVGLLLDIHKQVYSSTVTTNPIVKSIPDAIRQHRRSILSGCKCLLIDEVAANNTNVKSNTMSYITLIRQLGGEAILYKPNMNIGVVTHVIIKSLIKNTFSPSLEKVLTEFQTASIPIVWLEWVMQCKFYYARVDVTDFKYVLPVKNILELLPDKRAELNSDCIVNSLDTVPSFDNIEQDMIRKRKVEEISNRNNNNTHDQDGSSNIPVKISHVMVDKDDDFDDWCNEL